MAILNFLPIQEGTGIPSLDNVRPIHAPLNITGIGDVFGGYVDIEKRELVIEWWDVTIGSLGIGKNADTLTAWSNFYIYTPGGYDTVIGRPVDVVYAYSDVFKETAQETGILAQDTPISIIWTSNVNGTFRIKSQEFCELTTSEFKTKFANNHICYLLGTPIHHSLTDAQLSQALKQLGYKEATTSSGVVASFY